MQGRDQGKPFAPVAGAAASALLYAAAHPPWALWPLALVATAPVAFVLLDPRRRTSPARAAVAGAVFGALATWAIAGPWSLAAATELFGGRGILALGFVALLPVLASGIALHYALLFVLLSRLQGLGAAAGVLGSAALWGMAETARAAVGDGNPWASFAAALAQADVAFSGYQADTPIGDIVGFGGPALVAFLAAAVGTSLALAWHGRQRAAERGRALAAGALVVVAVASAGEAARLFGPARVGGPTTPLRVALVQGGVGGSRLWQGAGAAESFERHLEITRSFETRGADLVVWPESAIAFLLDANPGRRDQLRELARERGTALLVGGSRTAPGEGGATLVRNSAFLFPADGSEPVAYDKRRLLPFLERVPWWAAPLAETPWRGAYGAGSDATSPALVRVKDWTVAPLVCLEAIDEAMVAARAAAGADLLVNLSNDSWFEHGAGPEQHFALAALASPLVRRPLVRVATTGISALVSAEGLVSWRLPTGTGAVALLDVVPPRTDSLYVHGGAAGTMLFLAVLAAAAVVLPGRVRAASARTAETKPSATASRSEAAASQTSASQGENP